MYAFTFVRILVVLIFICAILEQLMNKKWRENFKLECLLQMFTQTMLQNLQSFVKPWPLNDGGQDQV